MFILTYKKILTSEKEKQTWAEQKKIKHKHKANLENRTER